MSGPIVPLPDCSLEVLHEHRRDYPKCESHSPEEHNFIFRRKELVKKFPPELVVQWRTDAYEDGKHETLLKEEGLTIKWGHRVTLAECQAQWYAMMAALPAPKVFAWQEYNGMHFLYSAFIEGSRFDEVWGSGDVRYNNMDHIRRKLLNTLADIPAMMPGKEEALNPPGTHHDHLFNRVYPFLGLEETDFGRHWLHKNPRLQLDQKAELDRQESGSARYEFCHGNILPKNVLVRYERGSWGMVALLNWEYAGWCCKDADNIIMNHSGAWPGEFLTSRPIRWVENDAREFGPLGG
ncbi:MAG: hypothetical protein Q9159_002347 [Coniocarpon cinnabarinum]